jgi:hypothetical protein
MGQFALHALQIFLGGGEQFSSCLLLMAHLLTADFGGNGGVRCSFSRIWWRMGSGERSVAVATGGSRVRASRRRLRRFLSVAWLRFWLLRFRCRSFLCRRRRWRGGSFSDFIRCGYSDGRCLPLLRQLWLFLFACHAQQQGQDQNRSNELAPTIHAKFCNIAAALVSAWTTAQEQASRTTFVHDKPQAVLSDTVVLQPLTHQYHFGSGPSRDFCILCLLRARQGKD